MKPLCQRRKPSSRNLCRHFPEQNRVKERKTMESGGRQIGGYLRPVGKGKIVLYTPGHTLSVWQDANWQRLLRNTIRYLVRE